MIEILTSGALNSIQDNGRPGYLNMGVAQSGAMDKPALLLGNIILGNSITCAGIEIAIFPFKMRFLSDHQFSVTGADCQLSLSGVPIPPAWLCNAREGEVLTIEAPRKGARSYVCVAGGIDVPCVLGSRSTDLKSAMGGIEGRGLKRGDIVPVFHCDDFDFQGGIASSVSSLRDLGDIRVTRAAEFRQFSSKAIRTFLNSSWEISQEANRLGIRLLGPSIEPCVRTEMLSHGILPGTVQIPPSGQPIVQMADANTCGGYPKIANVIDADIGRLAQLKVGQVFRFQVVDHSEATAIEFNLEDELARARLAVGVRK